MAVERCTTIIEGKRFTKADRLLHRSEFVYLTEHGRRLQNKHFLAYACKSTHNRCRLGITVTRKVGNAARRNRIKRLAREYFRQHRQIFKENWDINLIAKIEATEISNQTLFSSMENLFVRIAALHNE